MKGIVGASIVSIITESLYDKPIVVFREYIQNAADAMAVIKPSDSLVAHIWQRDNNLFFLDNGCGINSQSFENKMINIAHSGKSKDKNIGYKGIGRLSGLPYCKNLVFINIVDFQNAVFQEYRIDGDKYLSVRNNESFNQMSFQELMSEIGTLIQTPDPDQIKSIIGEYATIFSSQNTGFLVILEQISPVLQNTINESDFFSNLSWLLPVPFEDNIKDSEPFSSLSREAAFDTNPVVPARSFNIWFENNQIKRPLNSDMLRTYLCKSNLEKYAVCVHAFSNKKIAIDKNNPFSGIRIYIDNMLLCDENELIPALQQYGLTNHGAYELIQTVKGIGAMIYIVDKVNISANARRTFIDITDDDSLNFLKLLGEFVDHIYVARYALSDYHSARAKEDVEKEKISSLREKARKSLENLASSEITIEEEEEKPTDFQSLSITEKKRLIKNRISKEINTALKRYLSQVEEFNPDTCFDDFKIWLKGL